MRSPHRSQGYTTATIIIYNVISTDCARFLFGARASAMSFHSVNQVIHHLKRHQWQEQQMFQRLLEEWSDLVGPVVAAQTEPTRITQQRVLQVATSSGVWAHNLSFERQNLLKKINDRFQLNLTDIFFASSQWGRSQFKAYVPNQGELPNASYEKVASLPQRDRPQDAKDAFNRWAETIRERSQTLPDCPQCHCPSPQVELDRWGMCSLCCARHRLGPESNANASSAPSLSTE